ncbi:MAG: DUF975 family protein [Clostridia bacterium]|nr:DUF975 family protein [Clostridia bacterium]
MLRRTAVIAKVLMLLKKNWQRVVLAVLASQVLTLALNCMVTVVLNLHVADLLTILNSYVTGSFTEQQASAAVGRLLTLPDMQALYWLSLATLLLTPVLTLGLYDLLLAMLRDPREGEGVEGDVRFVFSRFRDSLKAFWCTVLVTLRVVLATLPGFALSLGIVVLAAFTGNSGILSLIYAGSIMSTVMGIRAEYLYRLSLACLADDSDAGVRAALRRSRELMYGHRMELFTCEFTWVWISLIVTFISGMIDSIAVALTVSMVCSVLINTLVLSTRAAFLLSRVNEERLATSGPVPLNGDEPPADKEPVEEDTLLN